jgi:uncharacterized 2Fe-2S/4Fe-4S cluster protein (DUF4445 family)
VYTITFEPVGKRATCDKPMTVLEAAREAGVEILALCGGLGSCGRCRVKVRGDALLPPPETKKDILSAEEIAAGYRLACRTSVSSDTVVYIPEVSRPRAQKLQVTGLEEPVACCPPVRKFPLDLSVPTLEDTRSDLKRIEDALRDQHGALLKSVDLAILPTIGPLLRRADWRITVSLREGELVHVEPGDTSAHAYGIAVDLGSTKIAVYLVHLRTGETVAARGVPNPQIAYGEDIITRIHYTMDHDDGTDRLQEVVIEALNEAIYSLCKESDRGLSPSDILEITLVGNTAMHHFLLGLPSGQLARSPCVPVLAHPLQIKARELRLAAAPGAIVYCLPPVAGFVGSDHVAMVLAAHVPGYRHRHQHRGLAEEGRRDLGCLLCLWPGLRRGGHLLGHAGRPWLNRAGVDRSAFVGCAVLDHWR